MISPKDLQGLGASIVGAAREGVALAQYLVHSGARVTLHDARPQTAWSKDLGPLEARGLRLALGWAPPDLLDVDILFLHKKRLNELEEELIKSTLRTLWDVGLDIGHAVRTTSDCIRMAGADLDTQTSLLENRYLAGYRPLYEEFHKRYRDGMAGRGIHKFIQQKEHERQERYRRHGDTIAIQEPNIKEGAGGLRDLHHAIWLALAMYDIPSLAGIRRRGLVSVAHDGAFHLQNGLNRSVFRAGLRA